MKYILLFSLLQLCLFQATAQVSEVKPKKPYRGDTLLITYNPEAKEALLANRESIYTRITIYDEDGESTQLALPLVKEDNFHRGRFIIPQQTSSINFQFCSLTQDDTKAGIDLIIYNKKKGVPAAGAYFQQFFKADPTPLFEQEITHYPTNYIAYGKYFNVFSMLNEGQKGEEKINPYLQSLEKLYKKKRANAGLLAALCVGKAKTGQLKESKAYLLELMQKFPQSGALRFAFSIFSYEDYKVNGTYLGDKEVLSAAKNIFQHYPSAKLCRETNLIYALINDQTIEIEAFEQILLPLMEQRQLDPFSKSILANIYLQRGKKVAQAQKIVENTLYELMSGNINTQVRLSESNYKEIVCSNLLLLSKINLLQKKYTQVIVNSSAAIQMVKNLPMEDNYVGELLLLRAQSYKQAGNLNMAMEDYTSVFAKGQGQALDSIKAIYNITSADKVDFDTFLAGWQKKVNKNIGQGDYKKAPEIAGKDLSGNQVNLSSLQGKVVVINFWSIGCGPCIVEMPELNKLVEKYKSRKDVVFLAITGDENEKLKKFLAKKEFNYQIVNQTDQASSKYDTNALPVHLIIDKQGYIINQSVGAREDIFDFLSKVIERQL